MDQWTTIQMHWGSSAHFSRSIFLLQYCCSTPVSSSLPLLAGLFSVRQHQVECPSHQGETWRHRNKRRRSNTSTTEPHPCGKRASPGRFLTFSQVSKPGRTWENQNPNFKIHESEEKPRNGVSNPVRDKYVNRGRKVPAHQKCHEENKMKTEGERNHGNS